MNLEFSWAAPKRKEINRNASRTDKGGPAGCCTVPPRVRRRGKFTALLARNTRHGLRRAARTPKLSENNIAEHSGIPPPWQTPN